MSSNDPIRAVRARCANCGYDLFGLPHDVCPECGSVYVPAPDPEFQQEPDPGAMVAGALLSVVGAMVAIFFLVCSTLAIVHDRVVPYRGCGTHMRDASIIHFGTMIAFVLIGAGIRTAGPSRLCRRIAWNAALATGTALVTCLVILANQK